MARIERQMIGDKLVMPFTYNSGTITTEFSCLERVLNLYPQIGFGTTKSIGKEPRPVADKIGIDPTRGHREPIIAQITPFTHNFINAVNLTNYGAEESARRLSRMRIPPDKSIMASIFGKSLEEYVYVATILSSLVHFIEVNLSCRHSKDIGTLLGTNPVMVYDIIRAVTKVTNKPVFAKLPPVKSCIAEVGEAAMRAGAYGLTIGNTVGPEHFQVDGYDVLTNIVGSKSGKGIMLNNLMCVQLTTDKLGKIPIIASGGIGTADDVRAYQKARASFFGLGSEMAGMTEAQDLEFLATIVSDLANGTNFAAGLLQYFDMTHKPVKITKRIDTAHDFHVFELSTALNASPGQYVFLWIPQKGEKPFSVMDTEPLTIGFLERGCFTKELAQLKAGDTLYFRGPHGSGLAVPTDEKVVLVGGGSGICGIYQFAKEHPGAQIFIGAKDKDHIPLLDRLRQYGDVHIATEDGSLGYHGMVTGLLEQELREGAFFINCGPAPMVDATIAIEQRFAPLDKIYSSKEYPTRCGARICGSCADENGRLTCREGPFMSNK